MKDFLKESLYATLNGVSALLPKKRAAILLYHDVGESDLYLTVPARRFEEQMRYLKEHGYTVMRLADLAARVKAGRTLSPKTVVLTFDDAYILHLSVVLPILEKYGFHGTFFVATDSIGKTLDNSEHKPQPVLDAEALKRLGASEYADVEPHSCSHREFPSLSREAVRKEIEESRAFLERLLEKKCTLFAYPRGANNAASRSAVLEAGFAAAVSVREGMVGPDVDLYALPRNTINSHTGSAEFKGKLTHSSGILSRIRS